MSNTIFRLVEDGLDFVSHVDDDTAMVAHNAQFLSPDPACRLQVRLRFKNDYPPGLVDERDTALIFFDRSPMAKIEVYPARVERAYIRNSRRGVLHAINRLALINPRLGRELRAIAEAQTVWGEPDDAPPTRLGNFRPAARHSETSASAWSTAPTMASKRARRRARGKRQ